MQALPYLQQQGKRSSLMLVCDAASFVQPLLMRTLQALKSITGCVLLT